MRAKNESFLPGFNLKTASVSHGGSLARGKRKTYRPVDPKQALHVVLRSSLARKERSMLHPRHREAVDTLVSKTARRWGVRVHRYANVGNHLHLLIRVPSRAAWQRFSRELAGAIAMRITGARKGSALEKNDAQRGFWDDLAFTRIVSLGRDYEGVSRYLVKNIFEAAGVPMRWLLGQGVRVLTIRKDGSIRGGPQKRPEGPAFRI